MGSDRKLARAQARKSSKVSNPLDVLKKLQGVAGLTEGLQSTLGTIETLLQDVNQSKAELQEALDIVQGLHGELVKQRAVFMRMLVNQTTDELPGLLAQEKVLRAEYDALRAQVPTAHEAFESFVSVSQGGM